MLAMFTETVVPVSDLRYLTLESGECKTQIIIDLAGKIDVTFCPACREPFDPISVNSHIVAFSKAYEHAAKLKHKLSFRIRS
jgi:hypothetical protein